ncbi:MAG: T9SS type A sorting domain-containing protein [Bacteroides sp.]|nr:T9SS type A sorting domain-containing protein [Ruminococcus flavefaciens]MCM1553985.1 T9SS type A sorting domain-containing protein [Bacteroides sp.]
MKRIIKCMACAFSALAFTALGFAQNKAEGTTPEPTKATVRLVVDGENNPYMDRNQYQLLLDNQHKLADTYKEDLSYIGYYMDQSILPRLYESASATIPAGLSATNLATGVNPDAEASISVEPGLYDIFLLQSYEWNETTDVIRNVLDQGTSNPFYVDDLSLEAGQTYTFQITFRKDGAHAMLIVPVDLQLDAIMGSEKPSCEAEDMEVRLAISNIGSNNVSQIKAYYAVGTDTVRETFNTVLAPDKSAVVTFTQKLHLENGVAKQVKAGIMAEGETETANNYGQYTALYVETSELPLQVDTRKMHAPKAEDWALDQNGALTASKGASTPAFSPCFRVENAGTFRLSYEYISGRSVIFPDGEVLVYNVDVHKIRIGKTSENWQDWKVIEADSTITGSSNYDEFTVNEVVFKLDEPGDYAFCIYAERVNDQDNLKFRNILMQEVSDFSARLNIELNIPRIIPQDWTNASWTVPVKIENRGLKKLDNAVLVMSVNGTEAKREPFSLDSAKTTEIAIEVPVPGLKTNDAITISAEVLAGTESAGKANAKSVPEVSQNVAAFDNISDYSQAKILESGSIGSRIGLIYPVMKKDTLTAITVGWGEMTENKDINIAIQRVKMSGNEIEARELIYETKTRRGMLAGERTYSLPGFLLEPGYYFISVEQLGLDGFRLAVDASENGSFMLFDKDKETWTAKTEAGYPAIRAVFGSDATLYNKDASVEAISQPLAGGVFSDNEPIMVSVRNNGIEKVEIPVRVRVDDLVLDATETVTLEPYTSGIVSFKANLAAKNENRNITITAFTTLANDENTLNDSLTKEVISLVPADPYIMDFESSLDFATEGLNPSWTSLSLDQTPVLPLRHVLEAQFHYIEFPGCETDLGFVVFNPVTTEPSMLLYEYYNSCRSHSGSRFGASLGINDGDMPKDDWLISPKLKMPASNTQLSMWVKSFDKTYKESYEIWVSEGNGDPRAGDFYMVYPEGADELRASSDWENVTFKLDQYNNQEIHIAIRCVSLDAPMFMIDDIVIGDGSNIPSGNENAQDANFRISVYPNPVKDMVSFVSPDVNIDEVVIFNATGNQLHRSAGNLNTNNYRYNVGGLVSGLYFARISTERGVTVKRFIVR